MKGKKGGTSGGNESGTAKGGQTHGGREKVPLGICKYKEKSHPSPWDNDFLVRHECLKNLPEKKRPCFGPHPAIEHK